MAILKAKEGFFKKLKTMFVGKPITDELYEELEELLIQSDMGIQTSINIIEELERQKFKDSNSVYEELENILIEKLNKFDNIDLVIEKGKLNIIFVIGVNGVGKTTSIGKITNMLKNNKYSIVLGAADTFRAAAIEQLQEWANRTNVKLIKQNKGSDPAAVVFDTLNYAIKEKCDVAIIDTAGRLHNKKNLMEELSKINKIIEDKANGSHIETLLVIDATTGQNGLEQAKIFNQIAKISGIILTKYDGTAKGGIIFPIIEELKKPIKFIGVGEGINDLKPFVAKDFVKEIFDR
ncbi:signal recognition particle-docking protein FtsY [Oceanivirga salmonicida]|uniref:signal recognition particle-docking protein FtsY n=1 Tax=Oceanivirga salmonicida TaxID=1769291 RepID=UPI0012E14A92|nr:signal recognition particle-docking protein FtsY [Oceanivirga salmonicida]